MSRLILVRHGESIWNRQNRFTGWVDVSLSPKGIEEASRVGLRLADEVFDVAFSSVLLRAQDTLYEILKHNRHCPQYVRVHERSQAWYEHYHPAPGDDSELRIYMSEKLNERYYGDLQGLNKDDARRLFGEEQVHLWRRGYAVRPPGGESLEMTTRRVMPYYHERIEPRLRDGQQVLVSAHGNSLRALAMHIQGLDEEEIVRFEIPTGTPHVYDFDKDLNLIDHQVWTLEDS